jgi:hypothetical protein
VPPEYVFPVNPKERRDASFSMIHRSLQMELSSIL